jgi:hypothetical protein
MTLFGHERSLCRPWPCHFLPKSHGPFWNRKSVRDGNLEKLGTSLYHAVHVPDQELCRAADLGAVGFYLGRITRHQRRFRGDIAANSVIRQDVRRIEFGWRPRSEFWTGQVRLWMEPPGALRAATFVGKTCQARRRRIGVGGCCPRAAETGVVTDVVHFIDQRLGAGRTAGASLLETALLARHANFFHVAGPAPPPSPAKMRLGHRRQEQARQPNCSLGKKRSAVFHGQDPRRIGTFGRLTSGPIVLAAAFVKQNKMGDLGNARQAELPRREFYWLSRGHCPCGQDLKGAKSAKQAEGCQAFWMAILTCYPDD